MKPLCIVFVLAVIFFAAFPGADLTVSGWFYDEAARAFPYREHIITKIVYAGVRVLAAGVFFTLCTGIAAAWLKRYVAFLKDRVRWSARPLIYLLLTLVLGPGILVHQVIKESWGRARPVEIQQFGGDKLYTPPLAIANQGGKSFVSGHASMGFFMAAFALLIADGKKRALAYVLGISFGVLASFARIIQGAHYLSDTVFAAILTLLTAHALHWLIVKRNRRGAN